MRQLHLTVVGIILAVVSSVPAAFIPESGNLVSNGSFEEVIAGSVPPWVLSGQVGVGPDLLPTDGANSLTFGYDNYLADGVAYQDVPTTPGQSYELSYDVIGNGAPGNVFTMITEAIGADGVLNSERIDHVVIPFTYPYDPKVVSKTYGFTFTADSTSTRIRFSDISASPFQLDGHLDNVVVVIPEPAAVGMVSIVAMALLARKRMRRWGRPQLLAALACALLAPSVRATVIADSVAEFSGVQGQSGWQYGYIQPSTDPAAFIQFPNYDADLLTTVTNGKWNGGGWYIDQFWVWPPTFYTQVYSFGAAPNGSAGDGGAQPVEQWAVRRWISSVAGTVTISGSFGDVPSDPIQDPPLNPFVDGVRARIEVDGNTIWSYTSSGYDADFPYSVSTTLAHGSVVDFVVEPRTYDNDDWTVFTAVITPEPSSLAVLLLPLLFLYRRRVRSQYLD